MNAKVTITAIALIACVQLAFSPAHIPPDNHRHHDGDLLSLQSIRDKAEPTLTAVYTSDYEKVRLQIVEYVGDGRYGANIILGRTPMYFPSIEKELLIRDMPQELKYLPIVESHLNPRARSHRGAVGMWQFMPATARTMGLEMDHYIDERRNVLRSTRAALDYLQELYDIYEDWTLAIAAYNCGTPRMNRAIRAAGSTDFDKVKYYLPGETRNYIPRLIAASYLVNFYHLHNLDPRYPDLDLIDTESYTTYREWTFEELEAKTGVPMTYIRRLNPMYFRNIIPANPLGHEVVLPKLSPDKQKALLP